MDRAAESMDLSVDRLTSEIRDRAQRDVTDLMESHQRWEAEDETTSQLKTEKYLQRFFIKRRVFSERGEELSPMDQQEEDVLPVEISDGFSPDLKLTSPASTSYETFSDDQPEDVDVKVLTSAAVTEGTLPGESFFKKIKKVFNEVFRKKNSQTPGTSSSSPPSWQQDDASAEKPESTGVESVEEALRGPPPPHMRTQPEVDMESGSLRSELKKTFSRLQSNKVSPDPSCEGEYVISSIPVFEFASSSSAGRSPNQPGAVKKLRSNKVSPDQSCEGGYIISCIPVFEFASSSSAPDSGLGKKSETDGAAERSPGPLTEKEEKTKSLTLFEKIRSSFRKQFGCKDRSDEKKKKNERRKPLWMKLICCSSCCLQTDSDLEHVLPI